MSSDENTNFPTTLSHEYNSIRSGGYHQIYHHQHQSCIVVYVALDDVKIVVHDAAGFNPAGFQQRTLILDAEHEVLHY